MDRISLRLSEEEKDLLRRQAEEAGVSVSELIRDRLSPRNLAGSPATFCQVSGLSERIATLSATVERLAKTAQESPPPKPAPESMVEFRLEEIGIVLGELCGQLAELRNALSKREHPGSGWTSFLSRNR